MLPIDLSKQETPLRQPTLLEFGARVKVMKRSPVHAGIACELLPGPGGVQPLRTVTRAEASPPRSVVRKTPGTKPIVHLTLMEKYTIKKENWTYKNVQARGFNISKSTYYSIMGFSLDYYHDQINKGFGKAKRVVTVMPHKDGYDKVHEKMLKLLDSGIPILKIACIEMLKAELGPNACRGAQLHHLPEVLRVEVEAVWRDYVHATFRHRVAAPYMEQGHVLHACRQQV
eukprot:PhM_4_TR16764/c1_g1_i8/m.75116